MQNNIFLLPKKEKKKKERKNHRIAGKKNQSAFHP